MRSRHGNLWGLLAVLLLLALGGCNILSRYRPVEVLSPNGLWVVIASVNESQADPTTYLCVGIEIRQLDGSVVYRDQTSASARMRWSIEWLDDTTIHLASSDIGDLYWERQADGNWQRVANGGPALRTTIR
jgi:hypothetical protein